MRPVINPIDNFNDYDTFENGWTFLHEAAKYGNFDIIHYMLTETDIDPNSVGRGSIMSKPNSIHTEKQEE